MATTDDFERIVGALARTVPPGLDLTSIEVHQTDQGMQVRISTSEPGRLVGRRGTTAETIRRALADRFEGADVRLDVCDIEEPPPPLWPPFGTDDPVDPV